MQESIFDCITSIQKWPSIGKKTSLRLMNFFLQKEKNFYLIQRLQSFLNNTTFCESCDFPKFTKKPCTQCAQHTQRSGFVLSPHVLDYFVFEEFFESLNLGFLRLQTYNTYSFCDTHKQDLSLLNTIQESCPIYVFFNKTIEERIAFQNLSQILPKRNYQDCSFFLDQQESLYMLSLYQSEWFKEEFLLALRS